MELTFTFICLSLPQIFPRHSKISINCYFLPDKSFGPRRVRDSPVRPCVLQTQAWTQEGDSPGPGLQIAESAEEAVARALPHRARSPVQLSWWSWRCTVSLARERPFLFTPQTIAPEYSSEANAFMHHALQKGSKMQVHV